ncbi:hypothetical protein G7Y89_g10174 [Cudoniella acicularis]|uniref:Uncharacterized protein n=1 Tax=Cudoniella acicularis TaxID=354080 RepID=A0A8H4RD98_9HELO|nr:hypothetical protein G7Y89_g10174 [Cudoniella acicularis]
MRDNCQQNRTVHMLEQNAWRFPKIFNKYAADAMKHRFDNILPLLDSYSDFAIGLMDGLVSPSASMCHIVHAISWAVSGHMEHVGIRRIDILRVCEREIFVVRHATYIERIRRFASVEADVRRQCSCD